MKTPTASDIKRALDGPIVPLKMKGFENLFVADVQRCATVHAVTVLAMDLDGLEVRWAKRIFLSPLAPEVMELMSAAQAN